MQVEIKIDDQYKEPRVVILTDAVTEEIRELARRCSANEPRFLVGFQNDALEILE